MLSRAHGVASLASRFQNRLWYMAGMVRRVLGLRQMHNPVYFWIGIIRLGGKGQVWGLDKIWE